MKENDEITSVLKEIRNILIRHGEKNWSRKIEIILADPPPRKKSIKEWYDGMGSFGDLILSIHNGHIILEGEEEKSNSDLELLRRRLFELACQP